MGTKTVARLVNTTPTAVAVGANITFNNNTISTNAIQYSNGQIFIKRPGLYKISANFTATSAAVGTAVVNMQENGANMPGASASETVAAAGLVNLAFTTITCVKPDCCSDDFATITFNNVNAMTYNVANVIIEKIA